MLAFLLLPLYRILLTFWITSYKKNVSVSNPGELFICLTITDRSPALPLGILLLSFYFSPPGKWQSLHAPPHFSPSLLQPTLTPRGPTCSFFLATQRFLPILNGTRLQRHLSPLPESLYLLSSHFTVGNRQPLPRKPSPTLPPHGLSSPHSDNPGLSGPVPCSVSPTGQRTLGGKDSAILFTGQSPAFKNNCNTRQARSEYLHYSRFLSIFHMIISSWRTRFRYSPFLQTPN